MTKKSAKGEFNSFIKGLVTEASPLNFPEQAARDIANFELNKDGTLNRRKGFGFEPEYSYIETFLTASQVDEGQASSYVWEDPAGQAGEKYLVFQAGNQLRFFDLNIDGTTPNGLLGVVTLPSSNLVLSAGSFAAIDGKLVIATGDQVVYLVEHTPSTLAFSISSFALKTRDIWGVSYPNSDNDPNFRPTVTSTLHRYNLYNQGWAIPRRTATSTFNDPSAVVLTNLGYLPSDSDTVWSGMITVPNGSIPEELFNTSAYRDNLNASSSSSKGAFTIDLLNRGASRSAAVVANKAANPVATLATFSTVADQTVQGANVVCEFSGRVWYAGFGPTTSGDARSPDLSGYIAFSKLVRNSTDFNKCYQEGDPSSRDTAEIVDTDGGLIRISGITGINRLVVAGKNLLVFASNGVWAIEGGSDYGFSASNYKVDKISSFGSVGSNSVVGDGNKAYYWAEDSIYMVQRNQLGDLVVESLSETAIETFYEEIPVTVKAKAKGTYDRITKKLRWLYPSGSVFASGSVSKELILDLIIGAYTINTIQNFPNTYVHSSFVSSPFVSFSEVTEVFADLNQVLVGAEEVTLEESTVTSELQSVKYIALVDTGGSVKMTVAWFNDDTFTDWFAVNSLGVDAKAFLMTGAMTAGDSSIHKQTPLLVMHMKRTEETIDEDYQLNNQSSCLVRTMWDWATSSNSKKFSPLFQVYRFRRHYMPVTAPGLYDNGFELVTTRNKLRGRGRALSIYMETEPGKDCQIVGWNLSLNGNAIS